MMPREVAVRFAWLAACLWTCVPLLAWSAGPCASIPLVFLGAHFWVGAFAVWSQDT